MTSIKKNYIYNLMYNILLIVIPIILTPYVARTLYADGIGAYQFTYAIVSVFVLIASLGTNMYAQREIAFNSKDKTERSKIFKSILIIRIIMTVIVSIVYLIITLISKNYQVLLLIQYIFIIANMFNITWLFQGLEDFKKTATRGIFFKVLSVICIFMFVNSKNDLILYTFILAISNLLSSLSLWVHIKEIIVSVKLVKNDILKHIKPTILLFLPVAAIYVYTYVDRIILGLLSTESEVGFYSQSESIVKLIMSVITSLGAVMLPRITKLLSENKKEEINEQVKKSIKFVITLGLPMVAGLILSARLFVPWFLGDGYDPCILLIQVLSPLILIIGLSSVTGQAILIPLNKQKEYTLTILSGAIVNVIINCLIIPSYGAIGASISTLIAELIVNITQQIIVFKLLKLNLIEIIKLNLKPVLSTIIMSVVLLVINTYLSPTILNTLAFVIIGVIIYFISLLILKDELILKVLRKGSVLNEKRSS